MKNNSSAFGFRETFHIVCMPTCMCIYTSLLIVFTDFVCSVFRNHPVSTHSQDIVATLEWMCWSRASASPLLSKCVCKEAVMSCHSSQANRRIHMRCCFVPMVLEEAHVVVLKGVGSGADMVLVMVVVMLWW